MRWSQARNGPGLRTALRLASTSATRTGAQPCFEMWPCVAGASPVWRTLGSTPRWATNLRRAGERWLSPTAARKGTATIRFPPGDGHQPARVGPIHGVVGDHAVDQGDLGVEEIDLPQSAVQRLAFLDRQLEPGRPCPALDPEQITGLGAALEPPDHDRVDLV